jgi:Phage tail assembly chaperone, TAC
MKLAELEARGGMVDRTLVKKNITWKRKDEDGNEDEVNFDIFIRKNSFGIIDSQMRSKDERSKSALLISNGVRLGDEGEEEITYDQAYRLDATLAFQMVQAFMEVNRIGQEASAKN